MIKVNGKEVEFEIFPNKESRLQMIPENQKYFHIEFKYEDDADLIRLMFVTNEINENVAGVLDIDLTIYYMPYSRMDRRENNTCFTLSHVTEFINNLNFTNVYVMEPHSEVTGQYLAEFHDIKFTDMLFYEAIDSGIVEFNSDTDVICLPDKGAVIRHDEINEKYKCVYGTKERDFDTGAIKSIDLIVPKQDDGRNPIYENNVIILDDLCSKGGTFMGVASLLRKRGAKHITLIVAHCEKTIFDGSIFKTDLIDTVITSNSIIDQSDSEGYENLYVAPVGDFL